MRGNYLRKNGAYNAENGCYTYEIPIELIRQILSRGCQYLSIGKCAFVSSEKTVSFGRNFDLKYLNIFFYTLMKGKTNIVPNLIASCYGLEQFSYPADFTQIRLDNSLRLSNEHQIFKCIVQNSDTLRALDFSNCNLTFESYNLQVKQIIILCQNLSELDLSRGKDSLLSPSSVEFLCNNLSQNIRKLDLYRQGNFSDNDLKKLLYRCNKLTNLSLIETSVTDESVHMIIKKLSLTLVLLGCNNFSFHKIKQLASFPKLCLRASTLEERKIITKILPQTRIARSGRIVDFENDFNHEANSKVF